MILHLISFSLHRRAQPPQHFPFFFETADATLGECCVMLCDCRDGLRWVEMDSDCWCGKRFRRVDSSARVGERGPKTRDCSQLDPSHHTTTRRLATSVRHDTTQPSLAASLNKGGSTCADMSRRFSQIDEAQYARSHEHPHAQGISRIILHAFPTTFDSSLDATHLGMHFFVWPFPSTLSS